MYVVCHTDMITYGMAFDEPVGSTGRSKSVTCRYSVNCQSEGNRAGANHQSLSATSLPSLTVSCPGTGRAVVKIGHSNLWPGSKELCI